MLITLNNVSSIEEVKNFIHILQYFLISSKQGIIGIDSGGIFIKISCTNKSVAFKFFTLFTFYNTYFAMNFQSWHTENQFYSFGF